MDSYGVSYNVVGKNELTAEGVYIISYWTAPFDDGLRRIHTIAVDIRNGKTSVYNGKNDIKFDGSQDVIYITGYYLGG